jgi:hypothetical protein
VPIGLDLRANEWCFWFVSLDRPPVQTGDGATKRRRPAVRAANSPPVRPIDGPKEEGRPKFRPKIEIPSNASKWAHNFTVSSTCREQNKPLISNAIDSCRLRTKCQRRGSNQRLPSPNPRPRPLGHRTAASASSPRRLLSASQWPTLGGRISVQKPNFKKRIADS